MQLATIHTDGSVSKNPGGKGGWAFILRIGLDEIERCGSIPAPTTCNRAELIAIIESFKLLKEYGGTYEIELICDSQYAIDGIAYMHKWAAKGWITTYQTQVKNRDLWTELLELSQPHKITCSWVEGHSGDIQNERCHTLANSMAMHDGYSDIEWYIPASRPRRSKNL
jgi:ribonuclease HI